MSKTEILETLPTLASDERREIIERLCDLEELELTGYHQRLVDEALQSGTAKPATATDWNSALQRGLKRGSKKA